MLYIIFFFILGAIIGSFLNVCIHRLPRRESVIHPPSHCPHCKHRLGALDLIPIVSYLLYWGKCRYCKAPISFRYPVVELAAGALFVGVALRFPFAAFPLDFGFYLFFVSVLMIIFFTDLEKQVIPDAASITGIFVGLSFNYAKGLIYHKGGILNPFISALYGMLLGYALLYLIGWLGKIWFKKEVMGEGDLYLAALLGAYLGWDGVLLSIFLAYLVAAAVSLALLAAGRVKMGHYVPFGPALVAGGIITMFFGQQLVAWYLSLFF